MSHGLWAVVRPAHTIGPPGRSARSFSVPSPPSLPQFCLPPVVGALDPVTGMAAAIDTSPEAKAASCREATIELRRLCDGTLAAMFDGPATAGGDLTGPLVVMDP